MTKTLILLRHAKTETGSPGQDDRDRHLVERGQKATQIVGNHLRQLSIRPDMTLCSTAVRTTETWFGIEQVYRDTLPVTYSDKLYLASAGEILSVIAEHATDAVEQLLVVSHNPGIHELAMKLCHSGDEELIERMSIKFPTCASAIFRCHTPDWQVLSHARCELVDFKSPRMLGQEIRD